MNGKIASLVVCLSIAAGFVGTSSRNETAQVVQTAAQVQAQATSAQSGPRTINITAKRFSFDPAEVTLKKGETVKLVLKSEDVTHGIFVRPLKLDQDIPAGKSVEVMITPQTAGKFTAICDHFCGVGHGNMKMTFVVEE